MTNKTNKQKGFTAVEGLLTVLILVVIGAVGYMVYHNNHKTKTTTMTASIYSGWDSATLYNEKLTFSYPSNWQLTNVNTQNINDGSDNVMLKSPDGTEINIYTENDEHPSLDFPINEFYAEPTTFVGKKAFIDYYAINKSANGPVFGGEVSYSSTDFPVSGDGAPFSSPDFLKTRNMNPQGWLLIEIQPANSKVFKSNILSNRDYVDAKLIVQSMHY